MIDPLDPFGEEPPKSPGQTVQDLAGEFVRFVEAVGGPNLNSDAVATLMVDIRAWWKTIG